ncbi:MAG: hypothetical protein K0S71_1869 [Clostridia bacterium]|jgi:hypothetical protein|nr:hypothetical protein [Clostridia bacterium]
MKKQLLCYTLIISFILSQFSLYAAPHINVYLNRKPANITVTQLKDQKRYVPVKDLLTPIGYNVSFSKSAKALTAVKGNSILIFPQDKNYIVKNGQKVVIPSPIKFLNGGICISTDSLTPSLNATCMYFADTQTLDIQIFPRFIDTVLATIPTLTMPQEKLIQYRKIMTSKINYVIDERLFTLMAYANYLGYNFEYNQNGYSSVRKSLISDLKQKTFTLTKPPADIKPFFRSGMIAPFARGLGKAPAFEVLDTTEPIYQQLSTSLQEFYTAADIHNLFLKYQNEYKKAIAEYNKTDVLDAICKLLYFLKVSPQDAPEMTILINLADANLNGFGLQDDIALKTKSIMIGPGKANSGKIIVTHEYLHGIIGPILDKYGSELQRINILNEVADLALIRTHYNNWDSVVEESIVRALDFLPFSFPRHYQIGSNKEQGIILIDYFFNEFAAYPQYQGDLDKFIYKTITTHPSYKK